MSVALNRLVLDFEHRQRPLADRVIQYHDAPFSAEIGGVHDDVGFGRLREGFPDARPAQMAVDGLAATTVLRGELGGSLLARAVVRPKRLYIEPFSAVKTLAAITAFVPLFAILPAVFFDLLRAAKKAFFVFKGFDPA